MIHATRAHAVALKAEATVLLILMIGTVAEVEGMAAEVVEVIEELFEAACEWTPLSQKGNCKRNKVRVFMAILARWTEQVNDPG